MSYKFNIHNKTVFFVVKDTPENKKLVEYYETWGFKLILEADEKKALKLLEDSKKEKMDIDIIVWDSVDGELSPLEVSDVLGRLSGDLTRVAVLITEGESYEEREEILNKGITFCLECPVSPPELLDSSLDILGIDSYNYQCKIEIEGKPFKRVLLVEDHYINQRIVQSMLSEVVWEVEFANTGRNALVLWEYGDYDSILMDIGIPDLNGIEVTRRIREKEKKSGEHIPIVALTAHALVGDRERFLASGMDDYISKPFNFEKLYSTLVKVMSIED